MHSRLILLTLAALTVPLPAQQALQMVPAQLVVQGVAVEAGEAAEPGQAGVVMPGGAAAGPGGELDFNRLRQLIEESKKRPALTPGQQKTAILQEMNYDRSTSGILAARLEEARAKTTPEKPAVPEGEQPKPPADPAAPQPPPGQPAANAPDPKLQQELEAFRKNAVVFRRDVVLGRWDKVREFFAALPKENAAEAYAAVLGRISSPVMMNPPPELQMKGSKPHQQTAYLPPSDLLGLAAASPTPPNKKQIQGLAKLLTRDPRPPAAFFEALTTGSGSFGGQDPANRRRAAEFLIEAGFLKDAGAFLPDLATARGKKDYAAINLIARHRAELAQVDKKAAGKDALPLAWELSTSFLTDPAAPAEARAEALFRALSLIPELGDDTGRQWLEKTFKNPQGEGLELLASLGTLTAQNRENPDESLRLEQLKLQSSAVRAILAAKDVDAAAWSGVFTLFARQWAFEAEVTRQKDQSTSRRTVPQYDEWGNMFFTRPNTGYQGQGTRPIGSGELLECQPDEKWLATIEPATRNECLLSATRLLLKVKEENKALPMVKILAANDRDQAKALVREMIRVWGENHNPNEQQDQRSRYFYFYGFNNQSGSIPLTRSKQERNLVELAALVKGIRALDLGETFHNELADAFIACHSKAEVWRVEAIESIFGSTDAVDTTTLGTLVGRMRLNLAGLWPNPKLQQTYQTKRKDKELQEQILQGYAAARGVLDRALAKKPEGAWRLNQQLAALKFEESNYRSSLAPDHQHAAIKRASLESLGAAAKAYTATLPLEDPSKESSQIFETWFFAALGSPTLEALKSHHVATPDEYPKIKAALAALPGDTKARHLKAFATTLNTRLANVAPDLKLRYLEGASAVAGDHEELKDARDVLAYYRDLVKEIELDASVDGPDRVGTSGPFGLRVNLRHTREIERESGGFQKYLQNQTNSPFGFNFGRPAEDYRDKFEKAARAALEEHFEVVSLTFHTDKVESLTDPKNGWRVTPYAYFLLKPKGPQIDKVPPLKIDLDFNDTSGYVVLPITSAEVPIDASKAEPRPFRDLHVTQTLDERSHQEKGNLYLEVKANAHGLIPPLNELLDLKVEGFDVGTIEDRNLRVVELDAVAEDLSPVSEHEWRIELKPKDKVLPASFHFPAVKPELAKEDGLVRQRYVDVDLVPVTDDVALGGSGNRSTPWVIGGAAALLALVTGAFVQARKKKQLVPTGPDLLPLPTHLNVVSLIGYLRRVQARDGTSNERKAAIEKEISALEARYFGRDDAAENPTELEAIAKRWQAA